MASVYTHWIPIPTKCDVIMGDCVFCLGWKPLETVGILVFSILLRRSYCLDKEYAWSAVTGTMSPYHRSLVYTDIPIRVGIIVILFECVLYRFLSARAYYESLAQPYADVHVPRLIRQWFLMLLSTVKSYLVHCVILQYQTWEIMLHCSSNISSDLT